MLVDLLEILNGLFFKISAQIEAERQADRELWSKGETKVIHVCIYLFIF